MNVEDHIGPDNWEVIQKMARALDGATQLYQQRGASPNDSPYLLMAMQIFAALEEWRHEYQEAGASKGTATTA